MYIICENEWRCHDRESVVSWYATFYGTLRFMERYVLWNATFHGTLCFMVRYVSWNATFYGTLCFMASVISVCYDFCFYL